MGKAALQVGKSDYREEDRQGRSATASSGCGSRHRGQDSELREETRKRPRAGFHLTRITLWGQEARALKGAIEGNLLPGGNGEENVNWAPNP